MIIGLTEFVFNYKDLILHVGAVACIPNDWPVELYITPITIKFLSSPNKAFKTGNTYDSSEGLFIDNLIEDKDMQKHFPEEFSRILERDRWHRELELYRLEVSKVYSLYFHAGNIPIKKIGKKEIKERHLKLVYSQ